MPDPEELARIEIDALLGPCGWVIQDKRSVNLSASRGVAVRELSFKTGEPDYTLFVDAKAIGTIEAKPAGHSLTGVEEQSEKYVKGVPFGISAWRSPLPFSFWDRPVYTRLLAHNGTSG
jgi:type I restriction enzyme R subunit